MNLFTYGTLTFPEVWQRISVGTFPSRPAVLRGYSMLRVKDAVYPGIVRGNDGDEVRGVMYSELDEDALFELDTYESSFYQRLPVVVTADDGLQYECHAYIVPESRRDLLTQEQWDPAWFREHELEKYLHG